MRQIFPWRNLLQFFRLDRRIRGAKGWFFTAPIKICTTFDGVCCFISRLPSLSGRTCMRGCKAIIYESFKCTFGYSLLLYYFLCVPKANGFGGYMTRSVGFQVNAASIFFDFFGLYPGAPRSKCWVTP